MLNKNCMSCHTSAEVRCVCLQDRCDEWTLLNNVAYGPPAFRYYASMVKLNVKHVHIIRGTNMGKRHQIAPYINKPFYPCIAMHAALCSYLTVLLPNATIYSGGHKDVSHDFAHMLFAPVVFRGFSTMSYWAGLANPGEIYSIVPGAQNETTGFWGHRWHMINVPLLDRKVANTMGQPGILPQHVGRIVSWLMDS